MVNSKAALPFLLAGLFVPSANGQRGVLGGADTYCRDGWKFTATYVLEPWLPDHQHASIEGLSEVMHTDAKDGNPDTFHRVFVDPITQTYWGYDVEVQPSGETGLAHLQFKRLNLRADQLPKDFHPRQVPDVATFHERPAPGFPIGTFKSGQVIAVEVMKNPDTGQDVVDYIEVKFEPVYAYRERPPRDFAVSDVILHLSDPSLRVNGVEVPAVLTIADPSLRSQLIWLSVPGHGRFLLSLFSYSGYKFQKAGVVSQARMSFSWKGDRFELLSRSQMTEPSGNWNLYVLYSPPTSADAISDGFSYGEINAVEDFFSRP